MTRSRLIITVQVQCIIFLTCPIAKQHKAKHPIPPFTTHLPSISISLVFLLSIFQLPSAIAFRYRILFLPFTAEYLYSLVTISTSTCVVRPRDSNSVVSLEFSAFSVLFMMLNGATSNPQPQSHSQPAIEPSPSDEMQDSRENAQQTDIGAAVRNGREILFQAFNWESHKHDWWRNLETKVPDIGRSGFTSAWLPPATHSFAPEGYLPQDMYSLNSKYGSEKLLKSLLHKMKQHKVRAMADIVINHRVGTTRGHGGKYNRYDGISLSWDERAVTSCTGGLGNRSTGDNFHGVPNIDHSQLFVRKDITGWLLWLRNNVGFQDFRFDFARGYSAKYVKEYIEGAKPIFSVGEYWDSCNYNGHGLDYNQDSHRQRIVNWIEGTGQLSTAFDFTTKGILQEAVKGQLWRLRDPQGKPPGVVGWWPSRSVTFLDNHDTGSTQAHWPFPSNHIMEGYAYILTHPGIPTVFYDHFYDWGDSTHDQIVKLIDIRKRQDIHSRSSITILEAQPNLYSAMIGEKVCMKIGDGSWCPAGREWTLATCGHKYAVWNK